MPLIRIDQASAASAVANEDRAGMAGNWAWIIDGATDVVPEPLTPAASDAAWFADLLDRTLVSLPSVFDEPLRALPARLAQITSEVFDRVARRQPAGRHEHPSAAGFIVRESDGGLEFVALGDCSLIVRSRTGVETLGVEAMRTGDAWVRDRISAIQASAPEADSLAMRATLWPVLRSKRAQMNTDGGYAVFSITSPPTHMIVAGHIALETGDVCLLASDGLTRLIDVFGTHTDESLIAAAESGGLQSLIARLRLLEHADRDCRRYPRAKTSDDATGLLMRFER